MGQDKQTEWMPGENPYSKHVVEFCSCDIGETGYSVSEMVDPSCRRETDIAGGWISQHQSGICRVLTSDQELPAHVPSGR